ncbi:hypothetical protein C0J52_06852, partial [Blattella germanica]
LKRHVKCFTEIFKAVQRGLISLHGFALPVVVDIMADYVELENFVDNINVKMQLEEYQRLVQNGEYAAKIREWMINHKMESGEYVYPSEEERNGVLEETQRKKNYFHWCGASTKSLITIKREMEDFNKPKTRKKNFGV